MNEHNPSPGGIRGKSAMSEVLNKKNLANKFIFRSLQRGNIYISLKILVLQNNPVYLHFLGKFFISFVLNA